MNLTENDETIGIHGDEDFSSKYGDDLQSMPWEHSALQTICHSQVCLCCMDGKICMQLFSKQSRAQNKD